MWKIFRIFARVIDTNHEMNENFAIQFFEGNKVRIVWDAEQEKYYFAVADIVQVLTDTVNPRDYIKKMLRRDPELTFQMAVEDYRRQGYSDRWINERMRSIEMRKELTDEWHRSGIHEPKDFAILTNVLTKAWSGLTTGALPRTVVSLTVHTPMNRAVPSFRRSKTITSPKAATRVTSPCSMTRTTPNTVRHTEVSRVIPFPVRLRATYSFVTILS